MMSMSACFIIDDCEIEGRNVFFKDIYDVNDTKSIPVYFKYEKGYGYYYLSVYVKDLLTNEVHAFSFDKEDEKQELIFPESCKGKVEVYASLKSEYGDEGPVDRIDPPKWIYEDPEYVEIRNNPIDFLKSLKNENDLMKFTKSFLLDVPGLDQLRIPLLKKETFSLSERENIDKCISEFKNDSDTDSLGEPPLTYIYTYEFIDKWDALFLPPRWIFEDAKYVEVRNNPIGFLRNLNNKDDLLKFIKSFLLKHDGNDQLMTPYLEKENFSSSERRNIDKCISEFKKSIHIDNPYGVPIIKYTFNFIDEWCAIPLERREKRWKREREKRWKRQSQ